MINLMLIGKRIKELRLIKGYSAKQIAEQIGITASALSMVEAGRRGISIEVAKKLSEIFKVSTDYLLGNTDDPTPPAILTNEAKLRTIPIYDGAIAGMNESFPNESKVVKYTTIWVDLPGHYGVIIHGDSMEPEISDGDIAIVDTRQEVLNGKKALIFWDGGIFIRTFYRQNGTVTLVSANSDYPPITIKSSEISKYVLGKVILLIKNCL